MKEREAGRGWETSSGEYCSPRNNPLKIISHFFVLGSFISRTKGESEGISAEILFRI